MSAPVPPATVRLYGAKGPNWAGFGALLWREMRRYVKEAPETVLAPAFSTLVYLAIFVLAIGPDIGTADGEAVLNFLVPGLVMFTVLFRAVETTAFSVTFQKIERTISDILGAPLSPGEITGAFALAGLLSGLATGAIVMGVVQVFWTVGLARPVEALAFAAGGAAMLSLFGILVGIWADKWDQMGAAFTFVMLPLGFLSGVFAPIATLPDWARAVMLANPVFHAIDGFRWAVLGRAEGHPLVAAVVVAATCAVLWAVADRLVRSGWKLRS